MDENWKFFKEVILDSIFTSNSITKRLLCQSCLQVFVITIQSL